MKKEEFLKTHKDYNISYRKKKSLGMALQMNYLRVLFYQNFILPRKQKWSSGSDDSENRGEENAYGWKKKSLIHVNKNKEVCGSTNNGD